MRTIAPAAVAAIGSQQLALVQLVLMQFPGASVALNSSNMDIDWLGVTYRGAYGLGSIAPIEDSPGEVKGLQFSMSGVSSEYLALALDDSAIVQGTPVTIRTAILDAAYAVVDAPIDWLGRLDTMSIEEDGETCTIAATAESTAVDLLGGAALTYSDADQRSLFPTDRAFEFVVSQSEKPVVWAGKQWLIALGGR